MTTPTTALLPNTYAQCSVALIVASLTNRKHFAPEPLQALSDNIKARGIDQPIIIRALPGHRLAETFDAHNGAYLGKSAPMPIYEIVSGERRYRAGVMAGLVQVPVILRQYNDLEAIEAQLIENIQRESLSELDEAEGFDYWLQQPGITTATIADKINKSVRYVQTRLQLLKLQPETKAALRDNQIDVSRALLLAPVHDSKLQLKALDYAATVPTGGTQPSVRDLSIWLRQNVMLDLARAPFQITDANLVPLAGSCKACPKRTGADPDMFSHVDGADICTDPPCYNLKCEAHLAELQHQADKRGMRLIHGTEAKSICYEKSSTLKDYSPLSQVRNDLAGQAKGQRLDHLLSPSPAVPIAGAVLIENPFTRELIPAIPTVEAEAALLAKGLVKVLETKAPKADAKASKLSYDDNVKRIKADAEGRIVDAYEEALDKSVIDAITSTPDDEAAGLISAALLRATHGGELRYHSGKVALERLNIDATTEAELSDAQVFKFYAMYVAIDDNPASEALAKASGVDLGALKHQAADKIKAEITAEIAALKPAEKPLLPLPPLAQPSALPNASAQNTPAALRKGKGKLSAQDAQLGIAAAMQGIEGESALADSLPVTPPLDTAEPRLKAKVTNPAKPAAAPGAVPQSEGQGNLLVGFAIGQRVTVTTDTDKLGAIVAKHAGKTGTITKREDGGGYWDVTFKGRNGGVVLLAEDQIEVAV